MSHKESYDIIIIGAGPAGMAAAIYACKSPCSVLLLDRLDKIGKKILVTGNGRCNITNLKQNIDCYRSQTPDKAWETVSRFNERALIALIRQLGVLCKDRDGYVYPNNDQAAAVREALEEYLMSLPGLTIRTGQAADQVQWDETDQLFRVLVGDKDHYEYRAPNLIICTGGLAGVRLGCQGDGYGFAKVFGHKPIPAMPSLTALCSKAPFLKRLSGVRCPAKITILADDQVLCEEAGELQWTDYGISGVAVFSLSRYAIQAMEEGKKVKASIDLLDDLTKKSLQASLAYTGYSCSYKNSLTLLKGLIHHKLAPIVLREAGIDPDLPVSDLHMADYERLVNVLKGFELRISGYKSYDKAQTTMGGVPLTELTDQMESVYQPGLFFAGEVTDVDGTCGGYNLQWAFSSGKAAGEAAGQRIASIEG